MFGPLFFVNDDWRLDASKEARLNSCCSVSHQCAKRFQDSPRSNDERICNLYEGENN
jgi:hypothetical protein